MVSTDAFKATIVSLFPGHGGEPVREIKPGVYPGEFIIPISDGIEPSVLVVGDSVTHMYMLERGYVQIECSSYSIARSIVEDFCTAQPYYDEDSRPGIFFVPGAHDVISVKKNYPDELDLAGRQQRNWFIKLVEMADRDWNRYHHALAITDIQRFACEALKLKKDWNTKGLSDKITNCPACMSLVPIGASVCPTCRMVIDKAKVEAEGIVFAG